MYSKLVKVNKSYIRLLICALTLLTANGLRAQFSCKVEGTVKENGKNLGGATVSLSNNEGAVKEVVTGPNGAFSLSLEPNEEYSMHITKSGYINAEIVFSTMGFTDEEAQTFKNE